ncbi:MAG: hypothetical protein WC607_04385 [Candidatus Micrarchaeia archaeon]
MIDLRIVMTEESEFANVLRDVRDMQEKFKDPVVVGTLLHKLSEEKTASNLVLKEINAKLERLLKLEERVARIEAKLGSRREKQALSGLEERIVAFVKAKGMACAEDVQAEFKYKGRNAASSRMNALFKQGVLEKKRAGMKMFYALSR